MKKLKLAVVGAGNIFRKVHAESLEKLDGVGVRAVCDPDDAALKWAKDRFGASGYGSAKDLFDRETELDAMVCCAPPSFRKEAVEAAARRGMPVFMEKPPAASLDDARSILDLQGQTGTPIAVGFMWRHLRSVERTKELLQGRTVIHTRSEFLCPALTEWGMGAWFCLREKSGGPLVDQGIHLIDLIRHVMGDIVEVATFGSNLERPLAGDFTIEDTSASILRFATGACGTHSHSWVHASPENGITFRTSSAHLRIGFGDRLSGQIDGKPIEENHAAETGGGCYFEEMQAFLEAVRTRDWSLVRSPYADAVRSLATVLAMNESMEKHRMIAVPEIPQ